MPRTVSRTRYRAASRVKADSAAFCPAAAGPFPFAWTLSFTTMAAAAAAAAAASVPLSSQATRFPAAFAPTTELRRSFLLAAATAPATGDRSLERSTASASASRRDSSSGVRVTVLPGFAEPPPPPPSSALLSDSIDTVSSAVSRSSACDRQVYSDTIWKRGGRGNAANGRV